MSIGYDYAVKIGIIISATTAVLFYVFASNIAILFTYTDSNSVLGLRLVIFIQISALFVFHLPIGMMSASIFKGVGK